jgi:hypothetical protein
MVHLRQQLMAGGAVVLVGATDARAADAPAVKLYDSGWVDDTGDQAATGPVALEPISSDYAGPVDHVVVGIDDGRTMVTWMPGDASATLDGALLLVPSGTTWDQVGLLDPDALWALDRFTQPWRWRETCGQVLSTPSSAGCGSGDAEKTDRGSSSGGCLSSGDGSDDPDKTVENASPGLDGAEAELGAYSAWLHDGVTLAELQAWMDEVGFARPDGIEPALAAWIDDGGAVLALRLRERAWLNGEMPQPLRVVMAGDAAPPLPLTLGGLGGAPARDLVVTVLHDSEAWLPDLPVAGADHCLVESPDDFGSDPVEDLLAVHWHAATGVSEDGPAAGAAPASMGWESFLPDGRCTDCSEWDYLDPSIVRAFGVSDDDPAITRSRVRAWRPTATAPAPLMAPEERPRVGTKRVVDYRWELAGVLPWCDGTFEEGGGSCFSSAWWARRAQQDEDDREVIPLNGRGCGGGKGLLLLPLLFAGLRRRR